MSNLTQYFSVVARTSSSWGCTLTRGDEVGRRCLLLLLRLLIEQVGFQQRHDAVYVIYW